MRVIRVLNFTVLITLWVVYDLPVSLVVWTVFLVAEKVITKIFGIA